MRIGRTTSQLCFKSRSLAARSSAILVDRHTITVTGLSASTRYHYRVESEDEAGNPAASADLTFKTRR